MKILVLEDNRQRNEVFDMVLGPSHDLTLVETAEDAIEQLQSDRFDVIFLDHDLGGLQMVSPTLDNTGSGVVRWMVNNQDIVGQPTIIVHSHNYPAAECMESDLKTIYEHVYRWSFMHLCTNYFNDPSFLQ